MSDYIDIGRMVASNASFSVISLNNRDGDGINIGDPVMVNIKDKDGNDKGSIGEVKWIGLINNDKCVGVDMEDEFEYGMDGTINEVIKFACLPKHGLITLMSSVKLYNFDKKLEKLENGMINPNKYIRCEHGELIGKFRIGDSVFVCVKTKIGKNKVKGTLRWCGLMNGIPVGVVELSEHCENGTNGRFWRHILIKCGEKRAVAVLEDNIMTYTPIKYDGNCFVANSYQFIIREILVENGKYKIGQLLKAKTDPVLYGEATFFINHCGKSLVGMLLDESQLSKHETFLRNIIVGKPYFKNDHVGIIAKEKIMELFQEEIKFLNNSKLIDESSIKYKREMKSNDFQKNDLIKFINDDNVYYKITKLVQINGICCCEAQEAVLPSQIFYMKQRDVCRIEQIELRKSIYDCVLLDPVRIRSFERCKFEDLEEGCNVKFKSNDSSKLLKGIVKSIGYTDCVTCCVVELTSNVDNEILCYKINERKVLKKLIGNTMQPTVIVLAHALRKNIKLLDEGIYILDPLFITNPKGNRTVEKFIIFNYESKRTVKVKWKGIASKIPCLGCEMDKTSKYGTNGYFGGEQLFECHDKCGVLIHFDDMEECCKLNGHKCLKKKENDSIDEDCICCVKQVAKLNGNNQLKINDYLKRRNENELKILKWIGLVNNVEVIGVESQYELHQCGTDGTFCGIKLFDCRNKCGALFEASEFTNHIKILSGGIYILDPRFILKTKGSKVDEKVMIFNYENQKRFLKVKWKGMVNEMSCLGCEMKKETEFGTNGTFGGERLFECRDNCGVLIHLDNLKESCEQIGHNRLSKNNYNMIDEDCICCMKSVEKLNGNYQMKINHLVERMKNEYLTCKWIGLVNDVEVIGAEFKCRQPCGTEGTFCGIKLFDCPDKCGGLFEASEFTIAELEKTYLCDFHLNIILPYSITSIENGRKIRKSIILEAEKKVSVINLRWRGCIKGHLCVGVELNKKTALGTDGMFNGVRLFKCGEKNGVLVHVDDLRETCESKVKHQEIFLHNDHLLGYLFGYIKYVNPDYICCVEWLDKIKMHPQLQIGSSIKYKKDGKDIDGTCEWIGLINGKEAIGARMDCKIQKGFNGTFNNFELFFCPNGSGFLFLAEDMHHDIKKDKLYFIKNNIVDSFRIYSAKLVKNNNESEIKIGDPVAMTIENKDGNDKEYVGEVKWIGLINNDRECVGVDMEDEFEYGMDGTLINDIKFDCLPKHGLITLLSNVKLYKYDKKLELLEDGIINPNKYIKCEGIRNQIEFDKTYKINDTVFVRMNTPNKKHKMKGTLKWRGRMNGILVGVVELNEDHASGTNGRFWRQKLIDTREKRTVAVLPCNIVQCDTLVLKIF